MEDKADKRFLKWCDDATAQIRYGPDRKAVHAELLAHLEDAKACYMQNGEVSTASARALEAMGSATEIAPKLAKIHRPWLGYLSSAIKFCGILMLIIALLCTVLDAITFTHHWFALKNFDALPANYHDLDYYDTPNVHWFAEGYYCEIEEVGYQKENQVFCFKLNLVHMSWMQDANFPNYIWATDSNGNYYTSIAEGFYSDVPRIVRSGSFRNHIISSYNMAIFGFDPAVQWVEFHYDRDGQNLVLHIDLTGGSTGEDTN